MEKYSWYQSYLFSLKKVVTRLTKNWASDYIIHNLEFFIHPEYSYFKNVFQLEELKMSNVDLSIFEEFGNDIGEIIFQLCHGMAFPVEDSDVWYVINRELLKKYGYEHIQQKGGGEGKTEYCVGVFKLNEKIYKAEYSYYYSYYSHNNGYDYSYIENTIKEVKPVEKVITVYE